MLLRAIGGRKFGEIVVLSLALFVILISMFLSGNRSGWLGLLVIFIAMLVITGLRPRAILFSLVILGLTYVAIGQYASDIVERKREQTTSGYSSDIGRRMLMVESMRVGLEHPFLGVGMDELHRQLALRLEANRFGIFKMDSHFLPGYLFGATGIFTTVLFAAFMIRLTHRRKDMVGSYVAVKQARLLVVSFVILFVVRSLFSREILYSPTFLSGLGLVFGYYRLQISKAVKEING